MSSDKKFSPFKNFKNDIPASIVVFLVAVPLCLGIALASGAPLFSGLIAGMVGGIVVGALSGSSLGVSGPAAGLAVIVFDAIADFGGMEYFNVFMVAVILAGVIQIILGFLRGGIIAYYFPTSVILGMLGGIGVFIFLKQVPLVFGLDTEDVSGLGIHAIGEGTFLNNLSNISSQINAGAVIITIVSLGILVLWNTKFIKENKRLKLVPGPLLAVIVGIFLAIFFDGNSTLGLTKDQLVNIPVSDGVDGFLANFTLPAWSAFGNPQVYVTAIVIAIVASLETLLCVEATDKLDPYKRVTPANRELKAQGVGNMISGLIGGLPITQVIVRSSANIQSGGRTKASAVIHGFLILISLMAMPELLNKIPLATLAAILMLVGYNLAKPAVFKKMYSKGTRQFIPFLVTVVGIVLTDLLIGLAMGLAIAIFFLLYNNYKVTYKSKGSKGEDGRQNIRIELAQEVTFLNKATILKTLDEISNNARVEIDASQTQYMDYDVEEVIEDFKTNARERGIELVLLGFYRERLKDLPDHITVIDNGDNQKVSKEVISPDKLDDKS